MSTRSVAALAPSASGDARVIRLLVAYDGTGFRGWARQRGDGVRTVEGVLAEALGRVLGEEPRLAVAGRTDAGVHARGQVASFETSAGADPERVRRSVNSILGPEVVVRDASVARRGFHARHSATARIYTYRVDTGTVPDPFTARFVWHREGALSVGRMRAGAVPLLGEHDFSSFCRSPGPGKPTVRRLETVSIRRAGEGLELTFRASAFLHQMVRSLVGTLVDVGAAAMDPDQVGEVLRARDRSRAGRLAPPHGLTLERVIYGRAGAVKL
jgi:tRNA pseudouridine38-40 synthase